MQVIGIWPHVFAVAILRFDMRHVLLAALAVLAAGCASRRIAHVPADWSRPSGLVSLTPTINDAPPSELQIVRSFAEKTRTAFHSDQPRQCRNVLALSGGGMYGAYSVGVLCGWTASGTRPQFDTVTGISTGSIIGTFAFLGSEYDTISRDAYTTITDRDIYRFRFRLGPILRQSVASSVPLRQTIDRYLTDEVLAAVAREHARGRRLYFGTTNLDTRQLVVWDMGAIASSGRPDARELYRDIILASSSPPGFLPPVRINVEINGKQFTELHCDGGATTGVFIRLPNGHAANDLPPDVQVAGTNAYVIVAGKLYSDPVQTELSTIKISEHALNSLLYSQTRSELFHIYGLCLAGGMNFHLASIPQETPVSRDPMRFKPEQMRELYEMGFTAATTGTAWRVTPPGYEPQEQTRPRTGTQFLKP